MNVETVKISTLVLDPKNARSHDKRNLEEIQRSVEKFGQHRAAVVQRGTNRVLVGNGMIQAMKRLKMKDVAVYFVDDDDATAVKRALADNRAGELAAWDDDILKELVGEVGGKDIPGWGDDELDALLGRVGEYKSEADAEPQIDRADELAKKWGVERGQMWELGDHRLMCGDSTSKDDVSRLMMGEKADLCFTSPPYSDMRDYHGCDVSIEKIVSFINACCEQCKMIVINLGLKRSDGEINCYWNKYIETARECGFKFTSWNIWSRAGMGGSVSNMSAMFPIEHEWIFVFGGNKENINATKKNKSAGLHTKISNRQKDGTTKRAEPKIVKEYGRMGSVFTSCYASGAKDHPAAFPLEFPKAYIEACSDNDGKCYEPFSGSGTTLIACEQLGRKCRAMEISPGYVAVAIERWATATGKTPKLLA